jgi:hypothetical protein
VDCSKLAAALPAFQPRFTVQTGIEQLYDAYRSHGLTPHDFTNRYVRLKHVRRLIDEGRLDATLRWQEIGHVRAA